MSEAPKIDYVADVLINGQRKTVVLPTLELAQAHINAFGHGMITKAVSGEVKR